MAKPTETAKKQRQNFDYLTTVLRQFNFDMHDEIYKYRHVPVLWRAILSRRYQSPKTRVTLRVNEDVVKFFKSLGTGYQTKMNDVLCAFMYARLSGVIEQGDTAPEYRKLPERPEFEELE